MVAVEGGGIDVEFWTFAGGEGWCEISNVPRNGFTQIEQARTKGEEGSKFCTFCENVIIEWPLGVLKKEYAESTGINQKRSGISRGIQEKIIWNFYGSCFFTLDFLRGVTQFHKIFRGEHLF